MFFNLGPFEIGVLLIVALVVFGPDKLPTLAKDAARMLRTLRDMAQGARTQLRDELGPEFGNLDIRSFNPRTALQKAIFDDDDDEAQSTSSAAVADEPQEKPVSSPPIRPLGRDEAAPYDDDAT
ncbi:MAG: sec-independent translocase [Jatrophihabitans sp.]